MNVRRWRRALARPYVFLPLLIAGTVVGLNVMRTVVASTMIYVPMDVGTWTACVLLAGGLVLCHAVGPRPRRVGKGSALARLLRQRRYRRAVAAMDLRDDYGRPAVGQ